MAEQNNKLELYLNDTFEKECEYEIKKDEVEFVQSGIETLVQRIANNVLENNTLQENMKKTFEIYFKGKLTRSPVNIFGAGSFYEGTKNKFPNEFDFILVLFCCDGSPQQYKRYLLEADVFNTVTDTFTKIVQEVSEKDKDVLKYSAPDSRLRRRALYFEKHLSSHGPATWLRFIYENELGRKREIDVDYVAALKIEDKVVLEHAVREACALTQFAQAVLSIGSCFCIGANYSFTPTEVHIMRDLLSERHRKIYRILKYLINGHGDVEKLGNLGTFEKPYSSFMMKTVMIYHHYRCETPDTDHLGSCILEVLDDMCKYKHTSEYPSLFKVDNRTKLRCDLCLLGYLRSLAESLRSMQMLSGGKYDYEKDRIKGSVSKRYLDYMTGKSNKS